MAQSTFDAELAALKNIASYTPYIGYAIQAYGFYQQLFGPAQKTVDWNAIIAASEKRIIDAITKETFRTKITQLKGVAAYWNNRCIEFLRKNPVSPENIRSFDFYIGVAQLGDISREVFGLADYFADVPQEYATFAALSTANTLLFTLLATQEAYFIAAEGKKSGTTTLSRRIQKGIEVMEAWPASYMQERSTHLTTEIEQKYSGSGGLLGEGRQRHPTGWFILHDSAPDPATGSLEGFRYNHFPNKVEEVRKKYQESEIFKTILPDLLTGWRDLMNEAITSENTPLRIQNPPKPPTPWGRNLGSRMLLQNTTIDESDYLQSENSQYRFTLLGDGNVVLFAPHDEVVWASYTNGLGKPPYRIVAQEDGNVVEYDGHNSAEQALWRTGTRGLGGQVLILQDDRNLVMYASGNRAVWQSRTYPGAQ